MSGLPTGFQSYPLLATLLVGVEFVSWVGTQSIVRLIRAMKLSISLAGLTLFLTVWALVSLSIAMRWWMSHYGDVPMWALGLHGIMCVYMGIRLAARSDRGIGRILDASLWVGRTTSTIICAIGELLF